MNPSEQLHVFSFLLMNTTITLKFRSTLSKVENENIARGFENIFHSIIARFSRFEPSSELSMLNKANGKAVKVTREFLDLILFGIKLGEKTQGKFDITVWDILNRLGYTDDQKTVIQKKEFYSGKRKKFSDIQINIPTQTVMLPKHTGIDLGAYGKGYAIDKAGEFMLKNGIHNFLINAGGDILSYGNKSEQAPWSISLFSPKASLLAQKYRSYGNILLKNEAVAGSGPWGRHTGTFHHLINPRKMAPMTLGKREIVFVKAKTAMVADALATAAFLVPSLSKSFFSSYQAELLQLNDSSQKEIKK